MITEHVFRKYEIFDFLVTEYHWWILIYQIESISFIYCFLLIMQKCSSFQITIQNSNRICLLMFADEKLLTTKCKYHTYAGLSNKSWYSRSKSETGLREPPDFRKKVGNIMKNYIHFLPIKCGTIFERKKGKIGFWRIFYLW